MPGLATPFRAQLADGTEIASKYLPIDVLMAERKLGGNARNVEGALFSAYNALKREGRVKDTTSFEDFVPTLVDYEERPEAGNGAAPIGAPPSPSSPTEPGSPQPS